MPYSETWGDLPDGIAAANCRASGATVVQHLSGPLCEHCRRVHYHLPTVRRIASWVCKASATVASTIACRVVVIDSDPLHKRRQAG